jgi:hypothetical protein
VGALQDRILALLGVDDAEARPQRAAQRAASPVE